MAPQNLTNLSSPAEENENITGEEDCVLQVLKLLDVSVSSSTQSNENSTDTSAHNLGIESMSAFFKEIETSVITENEHQIENLSRDLKSEKETRVNCEYKLEKLVEFITFVHGEFGKLLQSLVSMASTSVTGVSNVLCLGPFENENELNELLDMLRNLSSEFLNKFESLGTTKDLLEKINVILNAKGAAGMISDISNEQPIEHVQSTSTPPLTTTARPELEISYESVRTSVRIPKQRGRPSKRRVLIKTENSLASANKRHGVDYSKHHWGHYCLCGTKSQSRAKLMVHVRYFNTDLRFECQICSKGYPFQSVLQRHMLLSHKIEKLSSNSITCSMCQSQVKTWKEFQQHLRRMHNTENRKKRRRKSRKCTNGRGGDHQGYHDIDVTSNTPTRCVCGKMYLSRTALMWHINTKRYGRVFKCVSCQKRFHVHAELKRHVRDDHGLEYKNKYGCSVCGHTFQTLHELRMHRNNVHQDGYIRRTAEEETNPSSATPPLLLAENLICDETIPYSSDDNANSLRSPPFLIPINADPVEDESDDDDDVVYID